MLKTENINICTPKHAHSNCKATREQLFLIKKFINSYNKSIACI